MPSRVTTFGEHEGEPVRLAVIENSRGTRAEILSYGAILRSLSFVMSGDGRDEGKGRAPPEHDLRNIVLGFSSFEDYRSRSPFFGATVGRYGNRIAKAAFDLDGQHFALDANERGVNHLHGGRGGFANRLWSMEEDDGPSSVRLSILSDDGDQGYPGRCRASCRYSLTDDEILRIEMEAEVDRACPVNLVHHSYWNLDGTNAGGGDGEGWLVGHRPVRTIDDHLLELEAEHFLPTDVLQIPTGERRHVSGTGFDFRTLRRIGDAGEPAGSGEIDHCLVLRPEDALRRVARLVSGDGTLSMELHANQPGVQVYTGFKLDLAIPGGGHIGPRTGLCLETEAFPNAPNTPDFGDTILRPGQIYRHVMEHRFTRPPKGS